VTAATKRVVTHYLGLFASTSTTAAQGFELLVIFVRSIVRNAFESERNEKQKAGLISPWPLPSCWEVHFVRAV
jgi:hypothetical protein